MRAPRRLTLTVAPDQAGRKVDDLLRGPLGLSGTAVKRAKRLEDGILLDGVRASVGDRVQAGQVLSMVVGDTEVSGAIVPAPGPWTLCTGTRTCWCSTRPPAWPSTPARAITQIQSVIS